MSLCRIHIKRDVSAVFLFFFEFRYRLVQYCLFRGQCAVLAHADADAPDVFLLDLVHDGGVWACHRACAKQPLV